MIQGSGLTPSPPTPWYTPLPVGVGGGMFPPPSPPCGVGCGRVHGTKEIHLDT